MGGYRNAKLLENAINMVLKPLHKIFIRLRKRIPLRGTADFIGYALIAIVH